ncbi:MAG: OmpA family protein [Bacteroidales bacterium]|nr:OmpA family protein [Bacteroidales bacterium]
MKKVFKFGLMLSLLMATTGVFAQDNLPEDKPEFPRVGMWSNWSVGGDLVMAHQWSMGPMFGEGYGYGKTMGMGFDAFAQKRLNHILSLRVRLGAPYAFTYSSGTVPTNEGNRELALLANFNLEILVSINDLIMGYNPDRRWSAYFVFGNGTAICYNGVFNRIERLFRDDAVVANIHSNYQFGFTGGMSLNWGGGLSYGLDEHNYIYAEYMVEWMMDIPLPWKSWHHTNSFFRLGYFYNFGLTEEDKILVDQRSALTFGNFRKLNNQINTLESQVATSRNNEKKLENRIAELEDQIDKLSKGAQVTDNTGKVIYTPAAVNSAAADSLQAVINQIKADQLQFYAMPFSVQYGLDEWNVSDEEMEKVNAVARVMKDNPDVKINVVGFADKSGSDQYNMKLSERRANEVKRLLVKKGIAENRISVEAKGKTVAFGDIQYAINRRVSFYRVID